MFSCYRIFLLSAEIDQTANAKANAGIALDKRGSNIRKIFFLFNKACGYSFEVSQ